MTATALPPAITLDYLRHWRVFPDLVRPDRLLIYAARTVDDQVLDDFRWLYRVEPEVIEVSGEDLDGRLDALHDGGDTAAALIEALGSAADQTETNDAEEEDLLSRVHEAPVVRLVDLLLKEALEARASDVHLEAGRGGLRARYRIDGVLTDAPSPPAGLAAAVVGRLKVMAELDVAERRRPQDGRMRLRIGGHPVDVRVSTLPTLHGESVVLRLLEPEHRGLELDRLGMADDTRRTLEAMLGHPHGVIVTTGPTGSGKTTTLYAALRLLRTGRAKIVTVEDPVEYALDGVAQVPVNRKAGVAFATALRSILRQDPDVLLVGEMRDPETAEICIQAAMTGHLVLSTLHTNDAPSALVRLLDLGVQPYLAASTVEGVLAQRLIRVVCETCVGASPPEPAIARELEAAGYTADRVPRAVGCQECRHTGYRGRSGVYEVLEIGGEIRAELLQSRGADALRRIAIAGGMRPLRHDGWRQVAAGTTTPEEVLRVTPASHPDPDRRSFAR